MESKLYGEFRWEGEYGGKLPVVIPIEGGVHFCAYRAASWSSVYAEDDDERIGCIIACVIYTHRVTDEADTAEA